ncbi:hypothetical protein [Desulfitobacterium sp.]|uniref:hypothetical protein n=1 Tax=Desulfitobacterium sp. TaxID=49981 RepID=UPI002B217070|nr:hypothetical protein [Desulfitobacterium sp.]MEA4900879.1 hypothetical protein [Desulfitobacterium sp.]
MKHRFLNLLLITILATMVFLSGCGSSKTTSKATSKTSTEQPNQEQMTTEKTTMSPDSSTQGQKDPFLTSENISASWVDAQSDVMSPSDTTPDGIMDGHFHLTMQLPQPVMLESIFIRYSEFGKELRWDWIFNNHLTPAGYNLSIYEKGSLLPLGPDTGVKRSGQVDLDLFAAGLNNAKGKDTFSFESGEKYQIELNYTKQTGEKKTWSTKLIAK